MLIHRSTTPSPTSTRVRRVAATLFATALLAACGTSGGDDVTSDPTTATTTTAQGTDDTTEPGTDETTTTGTGTSSGEVSIDDLEALLPTADDLGGAYVEVNDEDSDEDDSAEAAILDACPGAEAFIDDGDEGPTASREFVDGDNRRFAVELDPAPRNSAEDDLDSIIDVINGCDEISFSTAGFDYTVVMRAERYDDFGDRGAIVTQEITIDDESLPAPIEVQQGILMFVQGSVGVEITAVDGVDDDLEVIPADTEVVGSLSSRISRELGQLLGD